MKSQEQLLLDHMLKEGRSITALQALKEFGIMRLAARIGDIRERYEVIGTWIMVRKANGQQARVMRYSMYGDQ